GQAGLAHPAGAGQGEQAPLGGLQQGSHGGDGVRAAQQGGDGDGQRAGGGGGGGGGGHRYGLGRGGGPVGGGPRGRPGRPAGPRGHQACPLGRVQGEGLGQPGQGAPVRPAAPPLQRLDGAHADPGTLGQGFLGQVRGAAVPCEQGPEAVAQQRGLDRLAQVGG